MYFSRENLECAKQPRKIGRVGARLEASVSIRRRFEQRKY